MNSMAASQPLFAILSALVESRAGLHYGPDEKELFLDRVGTRASEAGFESLLDYYYFLRYDPGSAAELEKLLDGLVVNETFFFRELHPLRVLVERFVVPLVERGKRPRIWSAACSTGEEPLTLAMLLAEKNVLGRVDLVASDLSTKVLGRARAGRFGRRALREVPDQGLVDRWLRQDGGTLEVAASLREAVDWRQINLCEPDQLLPAGSCDVILCRNVLIYFSDQTAATVIAGLTKCLRPEAALFVGVSESLLRFGSTLSCEEVDQAFLYRKPR